MSKSSKECLTENGGERGGKQQRQILNACVRARNDYRDRVFFQSFRRSQPLDAAHNLSTRNTRSYIPPIPSLNHHPPFRAQRPEPWRINSYLDREPLSILDRDSSVEITNTSCVEKFSALGMPRLNECVLVNELGDLVVAWAGQDVGLEHVGDAGDGAAEVVEGEN